MSVRISSNRRSATSTKTKRPEPLVYFIDRSLGRGVAEALRNAGFEVRIHDDLFPQNAEDVDWLPVAGEQGWIVLTKDDSIRRNPLERQALANAGVRAFFLTSGNMKGAEMAAVFLQHMRQIERTARENQGPFMARLSRSKVSAVESLQPSSAPASGSERNPAESRRQSGDKRSEWWREPAAESESETNKLKKRH